MSDEYKKLEKHWSEYWAQFIIDNPNKLWNWDLLSRNPSITWDIVQANLDKPWNWNWLSCNPNIRCDIIQANPDKAWNWYLLSENPNISWDIVEANLDKPWDWDNLSETSMTKYKNGWINERRLKHIKAFLIQRHWRLCSCNPEYKLAQRCLLQLHGS